MAEKTNRRKTSAKSLLKILVKRFSSRQSSYLVVISSVQGPCHFWNEVISLENFEILKNIGDFLCVALFSLRETLEKKIQTEIQQRKAISNS